jgi:hypothetical protein
MLNQIKLFVEWVLDEMLFPLWIVLMGVIVIVLGWLAV